MDFVVNRSNFAECKFVDTDPAPLEPGQVRLRVAKFAFTANNITYAVAGEMLSYWKFFPAEEGWGRIPVWGIGVVEESNHDAIAVGERFFGYFPMSTNVTVQADKVGAHGFVDASPHRAELPPTYNNYARMTPEFGFVPEQDDYIMVLRVLFMTGYLIDDFLASNDFFGAESVVISSASSKTSIGLAHCLAARPADKRPRIIGLTSVKNVPFVEKFRYFDAVTPYDEIATIPSDQTAVFVDMAGNSDVIRAVHDHFDDELMYSCMVGITHWQQAERPQGLPGPEPQMFFAPDQIQRLNKELGPAGMQRKMGAAWNGFLDAIGDSIAIVHDEGPDAVKQIYLDTLNGQADPTKGHVLAL